jgi:carbamoyltransferase
LSKLFKKERIENLKKQLEITEDKIFFVDHHTGHAHYAYFMSPFRENVLVLTADAWGDGCNSSIWIGNGNNLELKHKSPDNSLARIYRNVTLLLGMKPNEHEYKVMGLAPYSTNYQSNEPYEIFKKTLYVDGIDFKYNEKPTDSYFWFKERLEGFRFDGIAGGLQRFTEDIMTQWVVNSLKQFGLERIVLSGGLALNIKVNKAISEIEQVNEIFVPSAGGDESQSIGSALYLMNKFGNGQEFHEPTHDYHGPSIDDSSLTDLIEEFNLEKDFEVRHNISNLEIAEFLRDDLIVGRCAGRSEFGPRALGNRSILANPSNIENLKKINTQIKYRDFWMPFTPSILTERISDYIENPKELKSPFMTIGFDSTVLAQRDLVAAIHPSDQTVRPQFVDKENNPEYYDLIKKFESLTGIGGLLNTSMNLHGEPIVSNSHDAIHTLINSELDILIINKTAIIRRKK